MGWLAASLAIWWLIASIAASWFIYDASPLLQWRWISDLAPVPRPRWINVHSSLDESTLALSSIWGPPLTVLDIFDEDEMTEPSILRARKLVKNQPPAVAARFSSWPVESTEAEVITIIFSAHELRKPESQAQFFSEILRCLRPGGRLVLVEHVRDLANFVVFGPGFLHFLPARTWRELAHSSGLKTVGELKLTPFVRGFVWQNE